MLNFLSAVCVANPEAAIHTCLANLAINCSSPITVLVPGSGNLSSEICILIEQMCFKAEQDEIHLQ